MSALLVAAVYVLIFLGTAATLTVVAYRFSSVGDASVVALGVAAGTNLACIALVGLALGSVVGTLYEAEDISRLETLPLSGRQLFAYKFAESIPYMVTTMIPFLAGTLFGYGAGLTLASDTVGSLALAVSLILCLLVALVLALCLNASAAALQNLIVTGVVRGVSARWRGPFLLGLSLALVVGGGALYRTVYDRLPFNWEILTDYLDRARTGTGSGPVGSGDAPGALWEVLQRFFGPVLTSPGWQFPPGGWVSDGMSELANLHLLNALVYVAPILAATVAIVSLVVWFAGGLYTEARSRMRSGMASGSSRSGRMVWLLGSGAERLVKVEVFGRRLITGTAAAAFSRELLYCTRETKRLLKLATVFVAAGGLISIVLYEAPWLRGQPSTDQPVTAVQAASNGSFGAAMFLVGAHLALAWISWVVPQTLARDSVGLDGRASAVWATSYGGVRGAMVGKWAAYWLIATLIGLIIQLPSVLVIGPGYLWGWAVGLFAVPIFASLSSAFTVGTSALYARFDWDNPQNATRNGTVIYGLWTSLRLLSCALGAAVGAWAVSYGVGASAGVACAIFAVLWVTAATALAYWVFIKGAQEMEKLGW